MNRLKNKVAVITGGTSGIGKEIVKLFVSEGAKVLFTGRNSHEGQKIVNEINSDNVAFIEHDVSNESDWNKISKEVQNKFGEWNILVNNAGVGGNNKRLVDTDLNDWNQVIDINLTGNFLGIKTALNNIEKGSIVNISSILGIYAGMPNIGSYAASKGGTRALTKAAAVEAIEMKKSVRVNSVHPALVKTKIVPEAIQNALEASDDMVPAIGEPLDIANAVLYLSSDESRYTNGEELVIDGGILAGRNITN